MDKREDSQIYSLEGRFPFEHTTDIKKSLMRSLILSLSVEVQNGVRHI